jgi:hypothetical protein
MQTARRPRERDENRSSFEGLRPTRRTVVWLLIGAAVVAAYRALTLAYATGHGATALPFRSAERAASRLR